jgi:DNA phosphorothioation-dependent restriction protein DptG
MVFNLSGLMSFASLMKDVVAGINELPNEAEFKGRVDILKTVGQSIDSIRKTTPEQLRPTTDFIRASKEYYDAQKTSKDADKDAIIQALNSVLKTNFNNKSNASSTSSETPIILKVDGKSLRAVITGMPIAGSTI